MNIGIMQPYFFPYIGYFQLIKAVDIFVIYDNIKFTKKGWIHRNRILENGSDKYISLQLKHDSDYLDIRDRYLSRSFNEEKKSILRRIEENYRKAKCFKVVYEIIEDCINYSDNNLFKYIKHSLNKVCAYLNINTKIVISSEIIVDHTLKSQERVIAICKALKTAVYINPIGGKELYTRDVFAQNGIDLKFIRSNEKKYNQFSNGFTPWLSIIDVMMFNDTNQISNLLDSYELE